MIRIVHLQIQITHCADFEKFVRPFIPKIRDQEGCSRLDFLKGQPGHYFTVSEWDSEKALNQYRESALFAEIWPKVKPWFASNAEAWSTETITS